MSHALRYAVVSRRIWRDEWFRALGEDPQRLWLYLLTSPHAAGIPGVLVAWKEALLGDLKWPAERFDSAWVAFDDRPRGMADWHAGLVWLPRAVRHDPPAGPNHVRAFARRWGELPECDLRELAREGTAKELNRVNSAFGKLFLDGSQAWSRVRSARADPNPNPNPNPNPGDRARATGESAPPPPATEPPPPLRLVSPWTGPDEEHRLFAREHGLELDDELDDFRWHCRQKREDATCDGFMAWMRRSRKFQKRDGQRTAKAPGFVEHERRVAARMVKPRPRQPEATPLSAEETLEHLKRASAAAKS